MENQAGGSEHPGSAKLLVTIVVVLLALGGIALLLSRRTPPPAQPQPGSQDERENATLPPLPEKVYDISGTVTAVGEGSFTISAKVRTDSDRLADGYRDASYTVRYDSSTQFVQRAPYAGDGKVPASEQASAGDLAVGQAVDVRSRENIRNADSFVAGSVTIKPQPKQ